MKKPIHIQFNQEEALSAIQFGDIYMRFNEPSTSKIRLDGQMYQIRDGVEKICVMSIYKQLIDQIDVNKNESDSFTAIASYKNKDIILYRCVLIQETTSPVVVLRTLFFPSLGPQEIKNYVLAIEEKEGFEKIINSTTKEKKVIKV